MSKKSFVWEFFDKINRDEAKCKKCDKLLKCVGGSTASMIAHVTRVHHINSTETKKAQKSINLYLKKSIDEEISRLASVDGVSFNAIAKSKFIQQSLKKNMYDRNW